MHACSHLDKVISQAGHNLLLRLLLAKHGGHLGSQVPHLHEHTASRKGRCDLAAELTWLISREIGRAPNLEHHPPSTSQCPI
eukprot:1159957-Pelagomonas_calceolata.AAC.18